MKWNSNFREPKTVTIEGRWFSSYREAARNFGCDPKTIRRLVEKHGRHIPKFEMEPPRTPKRTSYMGKWYASARQAARRNKVSVYKVEKQNGR